MTLQEVVSQFNTTPFIFAGSGITRRYYGLPDWGGLLEIFARRITNDEYAYRAYENQARYEASSEDQMPMIATLIEKDFNEAWYKNVQGVRSDNDDVSQAVLEKGASPFKAEICAYISSGSKILDAYEDEIGKLVSISKNNIAGIITTNYDDFFESIFDGYETYVGQDELVFSNLQGIAEIYKIHGSVDNADSIVINHEDYTAFQQKGKYLAAKLMTIFMEYPIIFIGYSITDIDVRAILSDIVECLPSARMELVQKRFVFIEYREGITDVIISPFSMVFEDKVLGMTKVTLSNFGDLYDALSMKKAAFLVKVLRRFKDDLYKFAINSETTETMRVAPLEDERIDDNMLAITIGLAETGTYGLARAVDSEKWYRNIVLHDLSYTSDQLLEHVYTELAKQNSWRIPVWYLLSKVEREYPEIVQRAPKDYSQIVSNDSIQRNRAAIRSRSMGEIWEQEKQNLNKVIRLLGFLPEDLVEVNELEKILKEVFEKKPNCLSQNSSDLNKSNIRKLIRIYDYLKYKKQKTS